MVEPQTDTAAASTESSEGSGLAKVLVRVAWLAILLGMGMEILILLPQAGFGVLPGLESVFKDLAGKVTWSTLVCAGLAAGKAASRARAPLMGLFGFLVAPLAFHLSRALQQGVAKTVEEVAAGVSFGPTFAGTCPAQGHRVWLPGCDHWVGRRTPLGRGASTRSRGALLWGSSSAAQL